MEPPSPRVTRADVARLAGVSPSLVSFTLNGGPRPVAPATAERVRWAVEKLGYVPNAAARALRRGATDTIGLVVHDITNPYYTRIAADVQAAARPFGLDLVLMSTLEDRTRSLPLLRTLDAGRLRGVIITTYLPPETIREISELSTRFVQLDSWEPLPNTVTLTPRFQEAVTSALEYLASLGHEEIGYVGGWSPIDVRLGPWEEFHRARGMTLGPRVVVPYSIKGGYDGARRLLRVDTPTAIFAGSGQIALGVLAALRDARLDVPHDVSVISFDDIPEAEYSAPPLTSLRPPIHQLATDAVAALVSPDLAPLGRQLYDVELVVRQSTARRRTSPPVHAGRES